MEWHWSNEYQIVWDNLKYLLIKSPVLAFFILKTHLKLKLLVPKIA